MNSKKFEKKLVLNKETIAHLDNLELSAVRGGVENTNSCPTECDDSCLMGPVSPIFPKPWVLCESQVVPGPA
jgi:hypothetical protein